MSASHTPGSAASHLVHFGLDYTAPVRFVVLCLTPDEANRSKITVKTSIEDCAVLINVTGRRIKLESHLCAPSVKAFLKVGYHLVSFFNEFGGKLSFSNTILCSRIGWFIAFLYH